MYPIINNKPTTHRQGTHVYYNDKGHITQAIFLGCTDCGVATVFPLVPYTDMIMKLPNKALFDTPEECMQASIEVSKHDYMEQLKQFQPPVEQEAPVIDIDTVTEPRPLFTLLENGVPYAYAVINVKSVGGVSMPVMVKASLTPDGNPRFRYRNKADVKTHDPGWSVCYVSRSYYNQAVWCVSEKDAEIAYNESLTDDLGLEG